MIKELVTYCQTKIKDLLKKKLLKPSKFPLSSSAFYVYKAFEIEKGAPRLIITY